MATKKHKVEFNLSLTGLAAVEKGFSKIKGTLGSLTDFASKFTLGLTGLGGALSLAGLGAGIKNIANMAGGISDVAAQTKLTVREVMIFQQAFKNAGLSTESLSIAIFQMDKNLTAARDTGGELEMVFKRLGLNIEELTELSTAERFLKISSAIASLRNEAKKTRVAMQIFGDAGASMKGLWADETAFASAERLIGKMPALFEKNAALWDSISDSIGNVGIKSQQFFAGFLDQNDTAIRRILDAYESLDFTNAGSKAGSVFAESFKAVSEGRFKDALKIGMVQASKVFEAGAETASDIFSAAFADIDFQFLSDGLVFAVETAIPPITKLLIKIPYAFGDSLYDSIVASLESSLHGIRMKSLNQQLEEAQAGMREAQDYKGSEEVKAAKIELAQVELDKVQKKIFERQEAFNQSLAYDFQMQELKLPSGNILGDRGNLRAAIGRAAERFGIESSPTLPPLPTPTLQPDAELDDSYLQWQKRIEELNREILDSQKQLNILRVQDVELATELESITNRTRLTEADFALTDLQKYQEKKALLSEESKKHEEQINLLTSQNTELEKQLTAKRELFDLLDSPEQEAAYEREITMLERAIELNNNAIERTRNQSELSEFSLGPDMTSFSVQFEQMTLGLQNSWGSLAIQMASTTRGMADTLTSGLGGAFSEIIMGTKSVGEAFANMGMMLLNAMVSAITEIIAKWIVMKTIMSVFNVGTGGILGGLLGFADGGRIPTGERLVRVNEEGSEYVVSARSPRVNDAWLDYANQGGRLADFAAAQSTATAAPSASKSVIVRSQSEIRREWKESGLIEFVKDGFGKRGLGYA